MKNIVKIIIYILLPSAVLILPSSCFYDDPPNFTLNLPEVVSFDQHIAPILKASCAVVGCHDGTKAPNLGEAVAYNELIRGGYISRVFPQKGTLYIDIDNNSMPPDRPLSGINKALLLKWLEDGAVNN